MAANTLKSLPRGVPPAALTGPDAGNLRSAATKDERAGLRLSIHGGMASERFDLEIEVTGEGELTCDLACSLSDRRVDKAAVRVEPERLARIAETVDVPRFARMSLRQGGFPPCSLIGRLEIDRGGESMTAFFMADPEQARTAGYEPPAEVMRAVEMIYQEAEKALGLESVRP